MVELIKAGRSAEKSPLRRLAEEASYPQVRFVVTYNSGSIIKVTKLKLGSRFDY